VPCSASRVVPGAHRVVGPGTHRGSGPREVHTTSVTSGSTPTSPPQRPLHVFFVIDVKMRLLRKLYLSVTVLKVCYRPFCIGDACLLRHVSYDDNPIGDACLETASPFSHIIDVRCYYVSSSLRFDNYTNSLLKRPLTLFAPLAGPVRHRQLTTSCALSLLRKPALQQAGRPRARRRKGSADIDCVVLRTVAVLQSSSLLSPPPRAWRRPLRRQRSRNATSSY
jgi:hypothetical protein